MTAAELVGFSVLWLALLALAALVLLLYRQVDKAYRRSTAMGANLLPAGAIVPAIAIVHDDTIQDLDLPMHETTLLAFVSTSCDACGSLMQHLSEQTTITTFALVTGDGMREYVQPENELLQVRWVASPADIHEQFRVSLVPTVYVVRDGRVLAGTTDGSPAGIRGLLDEAKTDADGDARPLVHSDGP